MALDGDRETRPAAERVRDFFTGVTALAANAWNFEPNQANLIRRWSHVILVVCLVLFSLVSVKIPLTIFAFAGGALAIGVGFGTQNLLKNFII